VVECGFGMVLTSEKVVSKLVDWISTGAGSWWFGEKWEAKFSLEEDLEFVGSESVCGICPG